MPHPRPRIRFLCIQENPEFDSLVLTRFRGQFRFFLRFSIPFLELDRRGLPEVLVAAPWVVPALDGTEQGLLRLGVVLEPRLLKQFAFERGEEAFGHGVIVAITDAAHRRRNARAPALFAELQ